MKDRVASRKVVLSKQGHERIKFVLKQLLTHWQARMRKDTGRGAFKDLLTPKKTNKKVAVSCFKMLLTWAWDKTPSLSVIITWRGSTGGRLHIRSQGAGKAALHQIKSSHSSNYWQKEREGCWTELQENSRFISCDGQPLTNGVNRCHLFVLICTQDPADGFCILVAACSLTVGNLSSLFRAEL